MRTARSLLSFVLVAPVVALTAAGCGGDQPDAIERKAIAEECFIYGLPIVMNYAVQYSFVIDSGGAEYKAPYNVVSNEARVFTWQDTTIVTPNSDTPYSMVWLDLRAEPVVISVPAVDPKRYYSVQMVDGNTFNYGYIGSRATGNEAGSYLVAGPGWQGETTGSGSRRRRANGCGRRDHDRRHQHLARGRADKRLPSGCREILGTEVLLDGRCLLVEQHPRHDHRAHGGRDEVEIARPV